MLLLSILSLIWLNNVDSGPIRQTKYGKVEGQLYQGRDGTTAEMYLGVPFAKAPLGQLRFRPPLEPDAWNETLIANEMPNRCIQFWYEIPNSRTTGSDILQPQSEDCLYLNIFIPYQSNKTNPVMVWIHGGSFQVGGMSLFPISGTVNSLIARDLIVVFLQYRLGPLGFASFMHTELPGNFGLEDQLFALQWVQENIANFGGNPDEVTLL